MVRISGVGKSSIIMQFTDRKFDPKMDFTIGVEFGAKVMTLQSVRPVLSADMREKRISRERDDGGGDETRGSPGWALLSMLTQRR